MDNKVFNNKVVDPGLKVNYTPTQKGGTFDPMAQQRQEQAAYEASLKKKQDTPTPPPVDPQPKTPTVSDIYGGLVTPEDTALKTGYSDYEKYTKEQLAPVDEAAIRQKTMEQFQAEIDAMNKIYAQKKQEEAIAGQGRLGSSAAVQARSGLLGSDFGAAQTEKTNRYNQDLQDSIDAEKAYKIQEILGKANKEAKAEIDAKKAARQQGYAAYMEYLKGAAERSNQKVTSYADQLLYSGTEINDQDLKALAEQLGVSPQALKAQYNKAKLAKEESDRTTAAGKFKTANEQAVSLAPLIIENLTGDQGVDQTVIKDFADKHGIDPNILSSVVDQTIYERQYNEGKLSQQNLPSIAQEYEYYKKQEIAAGNTPLSFQEYQNEDANRKAVAAQITAGGLNSAQQSAAFKLADDYEANSKEYKQQVSSYNRIVASAKDPSAAGDLALIFNFMKMLDPGSTVREGEFATAQNSGSISERITAMYNKVISGERLSQEQRDDFLNRSKTLYSSATEQQKQVNAEYSDRANKFGIPADYVVRDLSAFGERSQDNVPQYTSLDDYIQKNPNDIGRVEKALQENPDLTEDEILSVFNKELQTSSKGTVQAVISQPDNTKGGQCGRFVNKLTGLGVGDTYKSKLAKMDPSITEPEPGMVFTMPYKDTGHVGFIVGIRTDENGEQIATVKDSNYYTKSAPETVRTHEIPVSRMTGFRRVNIS